MRGISVRTHLKFAFLRNYYRVRNELRRIEKQHLWDELQETEEKPALYVIGGFAHEY